MSGRHAARPGSDRVVAAVAEDGTGAARSWGTGLVVTYAVLLLALPSRFVIGPLGGAGAPAVLLGLGCLWWWTYHRLSRPDATHVPPMHIALLGFLLAVGASFVVVCLRPAPPEELSTAVLGIVLLASSAGVVLTACDAVPDRAGLLRVARALSILGALLGALGIAQFLTGEVLVDRIRLPGLVENHTSSGITQREGFSRPAGTAAHPIEYGAVVTALLPLALGTAMADRTRPAVLRWLPVVTMVACVTLSISRSALVSAIVGTTVVVAAWPRTARRVAAACAPMLALVVYLSVPGMLGSLLGLFTGIGEDSSAASRTGSYAIATDFVERSPLLGRGYATFLPAYRILDNQYLLLLVEVGAVGLLCFVGLLATAARGARLAARAGRGGPDGYLAQGLLGAVCSVATTLALFDGLSFPMAAGTTFLLLGLAGASQRVLVPPRSAVES